MILTSGNLSENTSNSDVMLLQALLRQMGQDIPEAEAGRSYFGPATKQAVSNLQLEFWLPPTGVVDQTTASKINPTTYIAAKLNADTRPIDNKAVINQVLTNATFDLASTNVDTWVDANKTKPPLAGLTAAVVTAVTNQLKSLQRVFKITPRYDEMRLLLMADLDSANEIAGIGKENFTNQACNWPEQSDLLEFRWDPSPTTLWRLYSPSKDAGGRQIAGTPATLIIGTEIHVYARGAAGQLLEFAWTSTAAPWQGFDRSSAFSPAPQIAGNPAPLMSGTDIHVFSRGIAGQLLDFYKAAASTSWQLIDISAVASSPQIAGNPVAVQTGTDLHVYVRGGNGQLLEFYKAPNPAAWQVFNLSTTTTVQVASDPVVVLTGNSVHLYVRGTDGQLLEFYKEPNPAPWQVFDLSAASGGVRIAGTPVALATGADMHIYARGVGGQLLEFYKLPPAPWQVFDLSAAVGGVQIAGNLALLFTEGNVRLYTRGTLGQLLEFYKAPNPAPWQMFNHSAELGARITSDPVAVQGGSTTRLFASALCRLAPAAARRLYDSAAQVASTTQALLARYVVEAANTVETQVTQGQRAAPNALPNLAQLFGSLNYCDCDQCRSVYSPAAYLVDLLAFLKKPSVAGDRTILDLLLARRPDLNLLELSCENTNIPLPYIDLVNEVLEDAVMGRSAIRQTHGTPEELNATPEYVNDYAYTALSTAVYPQGMPFNLWTTEARVYLENLGVRRTEIMEAFCKTPSPGELTDNAIATEYLGLTTLEAQLITGATLPTPKSSWEFWGYTSSTPNDPDTGTPLGWVTLLNRVPVFLQQSGLTYTALTELLETRWINPGALAPVIDLQPAEAVCDDLAKVQITNLSEAVLNKMHRFLRLWWRLGWPMRDLDRVLSAFTPADMNLTFLRQLSHVCRLSERLNVPVPALLGWWAPLETRGYATIGLPPAKSFYELLFQNKTVAKFNPTSDPFALNPARTELQNVTPTLSDQAPAIMAALGISAADFTLLTTPAVAQSTLGLSTSEVTDGMLNLGNLSRLYRLASLARALGLSVRDCLIVKALTGLNPFDPAHTEDTLRFVDKVQMIRRSEFTVAELDYLLRHTPPPTTGVAPTDDQIGQSLTMLRDGMQRIKPASPTVPDPSGTVLRAKLTSLQPTINWTNSDIDTLMTMLNGSIVYTVPGIIALPSGAFAVFQDARVAGQIAYNTASRTLQFVGVMTQAQRDLLRSVPPDPPPNPPPDPKSIASAPGGVGETKSGGSMPATVASGGSTISPDGPLPLPDYDPVYTGYLHAIDTLFTLPRTFAQTRIATFVEPNEAIVQLFNENTLTLEQKYQYVSTRLDAAQNRAIFVKQQLSQLLQFDPGTIDQLLTRWVRSSVDPMQPALVEFLGLAQTSSAITTLLYPQQYRTMTLLFKIAHVLAPGKLSPRAVAYVFERGPGLGWLDPRTLPLTATASAQALYPLWERLMAFFDLRMTLGQETLLDFFDLANTPTTTAATFLQTLSQRTGWSPTDVTFLIAPTASGGFGFSFPTSYQNERALMRLVPPMNLVKRLGASASQIATWAAADVTAEASRSIKQAVKMRYDSDQWLAIAKPLNDVLREKRRAALVAYVMTRRNFRSPSKLYEHYLIDVEMSACQMTSRLKQAISAVQLFVQRCLLRLEDGSTLTSADATEWSWMKSYRVWEANRKIFLYPENWMEPDLRDNKTPFFKELEQELLQQDLTADAAEEAFLHYLEKLDTVARLDVCGVYAQKEVEQHQVVIDTLHVFGRTWGTPHVYYYRRYSDGEWSPWEKVDLDIEGDHLIPLVYNRRLYLFWPLFTEKARPVDLADVAGKAPAKYWEIKLAWSEYRNGHWSAKKTSTDVLVYPPLLPDGPQPPDSPLPQPDKKQFMFKAFTTGDLAVDCYLAPPPPQSLSALTPQSFLPAPSAPSSLLQAPQKTGGDSAVTSVMVPSVTAPTALASTPGFVSLNGDWQEVEDFSLYPQAAFRGTHLQPLTSESMRTKLRQAQAIVTNGGPPAPDLAPLLTSTPPNGPRGTQFRLDGIEFGLRETVTLTVRFPDGSSLPSTLIADDSGAFTTTLVTTTGVSQVGVYTVTAVGGRTHCQASRKINVSSPLSLTGSPSPALRGTTVRLTGTGFGPGELVTVRVTSPVVVDLGSQAADPAGVIAVDYPTTQQSPVGSYNATATGSIAGHVASGTFTVGAEARLSVTPTDGQPGTVFTLQVDGFGPSETVTLTIAPPTGGTAPSPMSARTDPSGSVRFSYGTSSGSPTLGVYRATATGSRVVTATFALAGPTAVQSSMPLVGEFQFATSYGEARAFKYSANPAVVLLPNATHVENMLVVKDSTTDPTVQLRLDKPTAQSSGIAVLKATPGQFRLLVPHQNNSVVGQNPLFYQDATKTFFVDGYYRFRPFYHPYMGAFIRELNWHGLDGLLQRSLQMAWREFFTADYQPVLTVVVPPYPREEVDFADDGAYAQYNWELFFHIPFLIADRLSKNQRFAEAQQWFHYMFDPMDGSSAPVPQRYWRTRPFYEAVASGQTVNELKTLLTSDGTDLQKVRAQWKLGQQVVRWRRNPFNPHLVARLRSAAYPKAVVMKYIDNLLAWADQLFRQDTIESINEATQLYILAADILGPTPQRVTPRTTTAVRTFSDLQSQPSPLVNAAIEIEHALPPSCNVTITAPPIETPALATQVLSLSRYFTVPKNERLLAYWETVADRLFKIRHCMSIEGVEQQLPLFEPPIEPALLARAAAMGLDIGSVLNDISPGLPHYRFMFMLQRANELCADLKALGGAFLAALEKKDAEALALLRSSHEIQVLNAVRLVKAQQIEETQQALEGLQKNREVVSLRHDYYQNIEFMNAWEFEHLSRLDEANEKQKEAMGYQLAAQIASLIPNFNVGISGVAASPVSTFEIGGPAIASGLRAYSEYLNQSASGFTYEATRNSILGGHHRRFDEWKLQERLAAKELQQIDKQILGAEIRLAIANQELRNHDLQVNNAVAVDAYMRDKFTNQELYDWMVAQISAIYFQSYQLAYDIAKRAEKAFQFELGATDVTYIQFGYWDSLKKGLLAGERLQYDLRRMEMAYLDRNRREYEISKHVSLSLLDPTQLVLLKETGTCVVDLPEALFDADYPGHYMRRLRVVSLTMPCVTGPYTSVNCTVTLLQNTVRKSTSTSGGYARTGIEDPRFTDNMAAIQSIVTSSAQNDSGLFELNFHDERYLPFEGAGAISRWRLELPPDTNQFDLDSISDIILHLKYTARDGGEPLRQAARSAVVQALPQAGVRLFSVRQEFSGAWHRFLYPADAADSQVLQLDLSPERFPFLYRNKPTRINRVRLFLKPREGLAYPDTGATLPVFLRAPGSSTDKSGTLERLASLLQGTSQGIDVSTEAKGFGGWRLEVRSTDMQGLSATLRESITVDGTTHYHLKADAIEDILLVCQYSFG